jgi:hypothetical protein
MSFSIVFVFHLYVARRGENPYTAGHFFSIFLNVKKELTHIIKVNSFLRCYFSLKIEERQWQGTRNRMRGYARRVIANAVK